jgi:hypothetical protein
MNMSLKHGLLLAALVSLTACAARAKKPETVRQEDRETVDGVLNEEISLKADRESLKGIRADIPEQKQKANDELALFLNLMGQGTEQPSAVRDKFSTLVERKRTSFREKVGRLRTDYNAEEVRRREDYMTAQAKKRESFLASKRSPKEISRFTSDLDKERTRFFADERDRRSNFEAEVTAKSKEFESYMHEKMNEFNEQYRLYSKKFSEKPKEKKAVTGDDFKRMNEIPAKTLGTEE